ncbi:hypothetical protein CERZMDRAFT_89365 [Cercospora zeae-maydis SCOH1-5]|uniref:Apple domain-containing protein n=1 Tax=Cercospora zeae-maydis SCOH1-5 TaxID=717836 RepID=A0A6A6EYT6_9PEZI|nr:hypothetical protein CERZMDRAFT_89365 [Cercospora zeae-maydis SCOH1-5]
MAPTAPHVFDAALGRMVTACLHLLGHQKFMFLYHALNRDAGMRVDVMPFAPLQVQVQPYAGRKSRQRLEHDNLNSSASVLHFLLLSFVPPVHGIHSLNSTLLIMKSFVTFTAGLAATALPSLVAANPLFDLFKTRQAAPPSCNIDSTLCPGCDGRNVTDAAGHRWAVTCDFAIEAEDETPVGGDVSTAICVDACTDNDDCFGVTFAPNGSCSIASGQQQGLTYVSAYTNLARLADAPATSSPPPSILTTITGSGVTRTTRIAVTTTASSTAASSTPPGMSGQCDLDDEDMCPKCSGQVAVDSNGKAYRVLCDTSLNSNGSYSPQEWLSPDECLDECDKLDFCTGATYLGERSCELARGDPDTVFDESLTAFLPLLTPTPSSTASASTQTPPRTSSTVASTTRVPQTSVSIQPVSPGCNTSAVTCNECDGYPIMDKLNGSYAVICEREPMCLTTDSRGSATQEECLQFCDQDVACLAAMWAPGSLSCNLCLRGYELSRVAGPLPYVFLAADIDGDDNAAPTTISPSPTAISCPASDNSVYVDAGSNVAFAIGCDSRFDGSHSSFVTASDFSECAALCTGSCDGAQFGATNRCGLYTDITFIGGAPSWTAAARITNPGSTGFPASTSVAVTTSGSTTPVPWSSAFSYASPVTSAFTTSRRSNVTVAVQSPGITTRAAPVPYKLV